jgi:MFS superfamily sulfate permease-like transporter
LGLLPGIGLGIAMSIGVLLTRAPRSSLPHLFGATVERRRVGTVLVVRPIGPVVYLNASRVLDQLRGAATDATTTLVVDCGEIEMVDATGALTLATFASGMERGRVDVIMAGLAPRVAVALERAGFWDGPETIDRADDLDAALGASGAPTTR